VIDRILAVDPGNEYAKGVRPLVYDKSLMAEQRSRREDFDRQLDRQLAIPRNQAEETAADAAARATLDRKIPEFKVDNVAFTDVVDALRDLTSANIFVNWRALESEGIDRQAPVTTRLRDVKFAKALNVVLEEVGGGNVKLGYVVDDGVITISTQEDLAKNTLTRVYDIRELLADVPDYIPEPEAKPAPATQPQSNKVEQITSLIQETVEPELWRDNGGKIAAIRELSGQLIITATPEMHEQIAQLLIQLREGRGIQVVVEARFIAMEPGALGKALGERLKKKLGQSGGASAWQLDDDEVQAVLKASQQSQEATILTAPRVTLFSGQRAFVNVSTQTAYVSGFTAIKRENGEMRYESKVDTASSGILLDVRATASADREAATLTLKPRLSRLMSLVPVPYPGVKDLFVQVPQLSVHELQTTLSLPNHATALIGGFTESVTVGPGSGDPSTVKTTVAIPDGGTLLLDGKPATQPAAAKLDLTISPNQNFYLLVKPTLVIPQVEKPKQFPLLNRVSP
jgi:hypothetical protein